MKLLLQIAVLVMLGSVYFSMGLNLVPGELRAARGTRRTIVRGLCAGLIVIPLVTMFVVRLWGLHGPLASGLVLLSVCPGAPFLVKGTEGLHGSKPLAAALLLAFGVITPLTAPATARALLHFTGPLAFHPLAVAGKSLAVQALPLAIGMVVRRKAPVWAQRLSRPFLLLGTVALALVVIAVLPRFSTIAALGVQGLLATGVLMLLGMAFGALMGESREGSIALAELGAVPNVGLALLLATGAGVPIPLLALLIGMFLLRVLINITVVVGSAVRARRHAHA